jgi:MFS family permease
MRELASSSRVSAPNTAAFAANYVIYTAFNWFPTLFVGQGWQMAQALQAMFVFNGCTVIGSLIVGPLVARLGTRLPALLSAGLIAASFLALGAISRVLVSKASIAPLAVAMGGAGAGLGAFLAVVWMLANSGYPTRLRAQGIGMMLTMSRLGGISSVFGGGWLLSRIGNDVNSVTGVLIAMLVLGAAGMILINRHLTPLRSASERTRALAQEQV